MKTKTLPFHTLLLTVFAGSLPSLQSATAPRLLVTQVDSASVDLRWADPDGRFYLESTEALGGSPSWQPIGPGVPAEGGARGLRVPRLTQATFYRLHEGSLMTRITAISPAPGETGVSVKREIVFRLSGSLAAATTVTAAELHAEASGRRVLARAEVSKDRQTLSLFPLEDLPGGTRIRVILDGDNIGTELGGALDADDDGQAGGQRITEFETSGSAGLAGTGVIGHVFAAERDITGANRPLANVIVTVDGAEETLRTTTDATGFFRLQPAPVGRFFVHVDGRTATGSRWPDGAYYPFVGKTWNADAGKTNNLANGTGEIFLPLIPANTLTALSAVAETRVSFPPEVVAAHPALAGVEIRVPPNSLYADNGARGGKVGIAAVPPDRLPEPLPLGLDFPVVITVQTDGPSNFDLPVPVRFPNLPNPTTGVRLAPGAKTALWSFNHDTGRWEMQGLATISADGNFAETDPGVGIRQPGWHGVTDGTDSTGPSPDDDPNRRRDRDTDPDRNTEDRGDCDKVVECQLPAEAPPYGECILRCSQPAIDDFLCRFNPFCDEDEIILPERTPIELSLCGGHYFNCANREDTLEDALRSDRFDDMLTAREKSCMYSCMNPTRWPYKRIVPCDDPDPCPSASEPGLHASSRLAAAAAAEAASAIPHEWLAEQSALWDAEVAYYSLVFDNERIFETLPEELKLWRRFIRTAREFHEPTSEAAGRFGPGEKDLLRSMPRPSQLEAAEWSALVERLDLLASGSLPPQGWPETEILAAAERVQIVRQELHRRGWIHRLDGLINGLLLHSRKTSPPVGSSAFPRRGHYFLIRNLQNGFEIRGRLSANAQIENLALPASSLFTIGYLDPESGATAAAVFRSSKVGRRTWLPTAPFETQSGADSDGDSLSDLAESILGSSSNNPDTDNDGVGDGAELRGGANPIDGLAPQFGLIARLPVPGEAVHLSVDNGAAILAGPGVGLAFVDILDPSRPVLLGRFEGAGDAEAVHLQGSLVLAGHQFRGLSLVSFEDPLRPVLLWRTNQSFSVSDVALAFGNAYSVGNRLRIHDLIDGAVVEEIPTNNYVRLAITGRHLLALRSRSGGFALDTYRLSPLGRELTREGSVEVNGQNSPLETAPALFVGERYAYVGVFEGFRVIDWSNPSVPVLVGSSPTVQPAVHSLVSDGGGALAVVTSSAGVNTLNPAIYDVNAPAVVTNLVSRFDTPGTARRVALNRGRMFVADGAGGLVAANYRALDRATLPPTVQVDAFTTSTTPRIQESAALFRATAQAVDDVLVREVEFYINGELRGVSSHYPFVTDLRAPVISQDRREFTLQARAYDTRGQSSWSEPLVLALAADLRGPRVLDVVPPNGSGVRSGSTVPAVETTFDEPVNLETLTRAWTLAEIGPDLRAQTGDDLVLPTTVTQAGPTTYALQFAQPLVEGVYAITIGTNLTDLAGNHFQQALAWSFSIQPVNTFVGPGVIWNSLPATRTNWSRARLPAASDFVVIDASTAGPLLILQNVVAGSLTSQRSLAFGGTNTPGISTTLSLGVRAEFAAPVLINAGGEWTGGESEVLDLMEIRSPESNFALNSHILRNRGRVIMEKGAASGILMRTSGGESVGIQNLPGATWELHGGSIVGQFLTPPSAFENSGRFIKLGPGSSRIAVDRFLNPGEVWVEEGTLTFEGSIADSSVQAHVGTYQVAEGARLIWKVAGATFSRTTRLLGAGTVEFSQGSELISYPGDLEFLGSVSVASAVMSFNGRIDGPSHWQIGGPSAARSQVRLTGQNQRSTGRFSVERNGNLTIDSVTPVSVESLVVSNELTLATRLSTTGTLEFKGGKLLGKGLLHASGPVIFDGQIQSDVGSNPGGGRVEIAGPATCLSNAVVLVDGYALAIQTNGSLSLGSAKEFRFGRGYSTNEGAILKAGPGITRLSNGLQNRGVLKVLDGTLEFAAGGLFQSSGSTLLNTTGIVGQVRTATVEDRHLNISGGLFEAQGTVAFNSFTNSGTTSPGAPVGILDLQIGTHPTLSVFSQSAQGVLRIEIAGPEAGREHDVLRTTGRAQLDGVLEVETLEGYDPPVGAEFTVLEASRVAGAFASIRETRPHPNKRFSAVYEAGRVVLRVESVGGAVK